MVVSLEIVIVSLAVINAQVDTAQQSSTTFSMSTSSSTHETYSWVRFKPKLPTISPTLMLSFPSQPFQPCPTQSSRLRLRMEQTQHRQTQLQAGVCVFSAATTSSDTGWDYTLSSTTTRQTARRLAQVRCASRASCRSKGIATRMTSVSTM